LYGIQYYGSGDFRLEYCSIHGYDTIGYTALNIYSAQEGIAKCSRLSYMARVVDKEHLQKSVVK